MGIKVSAFQQTVADFDTVTLPVPIAMPVLDVHGSVAIESERVVIGSHADS